MVGASLWAMLTLSGRDFYWFRLMPPGGPARLGAVADVGA